MMMNVHKVRKKILLKIRMKRKNRISIMMTTKGSQLRNKLN
jgi:hypothetical protein